MCLESGDMLYILSLRRFFVITIFPFTFIVLKATQVGAQYWSYSLHWIDSILRLTI